MPTQRPTAGELVTAVREFIEAEVQPALSGSTAFHARVAANVLAIVERELATGGDLDAADAERLAALLGHGDDPRGGGGGDSGGAGAAGSDAEALSAELAGRIRAGTVDLATPGLAEHLRASILGRLAIDNPRYESYRRATAADDRDG